ncbi:MAG: NAD(+) diphosphatase [Synergistaceae bacterium]|nr:NAD(+) diphosphatase [Synergistaceae bacterium]
MRGTDPFFVFRGDDLLLRKEGNPSLPGADEASLNDLPFLDLRHPDREGLSWAEVPLGTEAPEGMTFVSRRSLWGRLDESLFFLSGKAFHLMDWHRMNRFCGRCGHALADHPEEKALLCSSCDNVVFPVIAPAVIVAVERDGKILLGRSPHFPPGRYSVLAGFVEAGESLETTIIREIREEVGIEVQDIRYFGSQPWPFPRSLMVGFKARWKSGEIAIDGREIVDARWFSPEEMPDFPPSFSIARKLIEDFLKTHDGKGRGLP